MTNLEEEHKHDWYDEAIDCPRCGLQRVKVCEECGEVNYDL